MNAYILLYAYVFFAVVESLFQRYYATTNPQHIYTGMLFGYIFFFWPSALVYTAFHHNNLQISKMVSHDWPLLLVVGLCAGVMYRFSLVIARQVEASTSQIVRTAGPISLLVLAAVFLGEEMTAAQYLGAGILICTTLIYISHKSFRHLNKYLYLAMATQLIFSFTLIAEKYLLTKYGLATYLPIGWGMQVVFLVLLTAKLAREELRSRPLDKKSKRSLLLFGLTLAPASILYVTSVNTWKSVSYVNAVSVSQYVLTAFAAIYILKERDLLWRKVIAVLFAALGLYLMR